MSLYFKILIIAIAIPLVFSFDRKLQFYRKWRFVFPAIVLTGLFFIGWDVLLTGKGIWGFNVQYHSNRLVFGLPIEEWLFFVVVPYASIFLHYSFVLYFPGFKLSNKSSRRISFILIGSFVLLMLFNFEKLYTVYISAIAIGSLVLGILNKMRILSRYYITFMLILIPFLILNSVLTGSFIDGEVFWYKPDEILGVRIFTIPVEDFFYAFSLIFCVLFLTEKFERRSNYINSDNAS